MKVLCYSSFTFSYLNRARVLFSTLRRFHPDWELVALITDEPPPGFAFDPAREPFDRVVWAQDLGSEDFRSWLFRHDVLDGWRCLRYLTSLLFEHTDLTVDRLRARHAAKCRGRASGQSATRASTASSKGPRT